MAAMFGESFWDFTIIGVSHWAFDANSIAERNNILVKMKNGISQNGIKNSKKNFIWKRIYLEFSLMHGHNSLGT